MKPNDPVLRSSFLSIFLLVALFSCTKEKEVTETITVVKVDTVTVIDTVFKTVPDSATTFILVRHAETTGAGSDPDLSTAGLDRATELSRILMNVPVGNVFSTTYKRTMQTADAVAKDKGLIIENYNPADLEALVDDNLIHHKEEIILVVGHSNTTPTLLNILVGSNTYSDLPETEYDNLFIVYVFEKGRSEVIHMKYGQ